MGVKHCQETGGKRLIRLELLHLTFTMMEEKPMFVGYA